MTQYVTLAEYSGGTKRYFAVLSALRGALALIPRCVELRGKLVELVRYREYVTAGVAGDVEHQCIVGSAVYVETFLFSIHAYTVYLPFSRAKTDRNVQMVFLFNTSVAGAFHKHPQIRRHRTSICESNSAGFETVIRRFRVFTC